jgi:hypothetical protein
MRLIGICSANYKGFPENPDATVELWLSMLGEYDFQIVGMAVKRHIAKSVYAPKIAEILECIADITNEPTILPLDAWGEVTRAIRRYGYMRESEAMESMSEDTKHMVRQIGYQTLCQSENEMADRAHFMNQMTAYQNRKKQDAQISPLFRQAIENKRDDIKRLGSGEQ